MEEMHARDPTEVLRREVRSHLRNWTGRPDWLARLHIFADGVETIPKDLIKNVSGVIRQVLPTPRRLDAYSVEEIKTYPKLFDWPQDYAVRPLSAYTKPRPRAGKVPTVAETKI
ncbi:39S ribosomal protein L13 mitochondrial [Taenia crassiceps]|uniref:39S ribosomal protein L13 mitochondrial n=1 Tax=Taenia crassiceps TaxID=6207 RepID=A0ABR4QMN8_9CEST